MHHRMGLRQRGCSEPDSLCTKSFLIRILGHQELEARLAKWFRCNDAKWADLICRIKSTELGTIMVPSSPKPAKVVCEEVVEKYDDDFDVDCDLPCMKVRATPYSNWCSKSIPPALSLKWWQFGFAYYSRAGTTMCDSSGLRGTRRRRH